jgi:hypothetical protein
MMPWVSWLATRFPLAFVLAATRSLLASQSVGGRWFGGVRGVPIPQRQLSLQIRDLLFGIRDPLIPFGYLLTQFLNLTLLSLDLPLQFLPIGRMRVRMPTGGWLLVACAPGGSCIHPP